MTSIKIRGLSKTYPNAATPALAALSLDIPSGSLTALLGPSGCGKTTALKMIAGLIAPTAGDVCFDDASILTKAPDQHGAVMVFQNPLLFPHMTVAENIGFGLRMRHRPKAEIAARMAEMLSLVQLAGLGARRPQALSGGQAQRVALARALILQPRVLLLDEPLSSLDSSLRAEMRDLILGLQRATGITTVVVTHDQQEAVVMADKIALILDGQLQQYGPPADFFNRPQSETVGRFFGTKNFIPGSNIDGVFTTAFGPLTLAGSFANGPATATIRPENICIGVADINSFPATLIKRSYLGTQTQLTLQLGEAILEASVNPQDAASHAIGAIVQIALPPRSLWLLPKIGTGA